MPKFKVQLQQYVEKVAIVEVDAESVEAARDSALSFEAISADWQDGDDAYAVDAYAVLDEAGNTVWER